MQQAVLGADWMSENPTTAASRIGKMTEFVCEQISENVTRKLGGFLEASPILEPKWAEEGEREKGWKYITDLDPNVVIRLRLKVLNDPFSDVIGLIRGVTIDNLLFLPSAVEYGTVIDGPIPAGVLFLNRGFQHI